MTTPREDPLADSLGYWVFRLHRAMHAAFVERLTALGVTAPEWTVLGNVERGTATPLAVAESMGIDRAAVTRIVDQLERKGLLRRTPHPTDGRSTVLEMTGDGAELFPRLVAASRETNESFLQHIPRSEAAAMLTAIRRLVESLPTRMYPLEEGRS